MCRLVLEYTRRYFEDPAVQEDFERWKKEQQKKKRTSKHIRAKKSGHRNCPIKYVSIAALIWISENCATVRREQMSHQTRWIAINSASPAPYGVNGAGPLPHQGALN